MKAETYNKWDVFLKALGAVGLIATAAIGLVEYYASGNVTATLETNKLDSEQHKLYFDKQLEYYVKATETVASIANTSDPRKRQDLIRDFDVLYYGPMVMFEERGGEAASDVQKQMVAIHECILKNCSNRELQEQSVTLANTCRFALSVNWQSRVQNLKQGLNLKERLGLKEKDN